ncbi:MAG: carboxypeptidase-like regulatory domain-containing protein, partial [Candidatus Saccharimonadales bacterium]
MRDVAAGIVNPGDDILVRGSWFKHVAAPGCQVQGVVRDEQTGRPLAGATVLAGRTSGSSESLFRTTTDSAGHFLLSGVSARAKPTQVVALAPSDEPYIAKTLDAALERPGDRATINFGLERGVWIEGQVTDKLTGRGVEATVIYHAWGDNPYLKRAGIGRPPRWENVRRNTDGDGHFRLLGLPGKGLVSAATANDYAFGVGVERLGTSDSLRKRTQPNFRPQESNTVVEIDVDEHVESVRCDIELESGRQRQGVVLGPDGAPLEGVRFGAGWKEHWVGDRPLEAAQFTVEQLIPGRSRPLVFLHEARKLIGTIDVSGDGDDPLEVRMQPWAGVRGRV